MFVDYPPRVTPREDEENLSTMSTDVDYDRPTLPVIDDGSIASSFLAFFFSLRSRRS